MASSAEFCECEVECFRFHALQSFECAMLTCSKPYKCFEERKPAPAQRRQVTFSVKMPEEPE